MDPILSLADLKKKPLVEERLKAIAAQLIAAHRHQNHDLVLAYARQAGVITGATIPPNLFLKTIQVFHPDRLAGIWDLVDRAVRESDRPGLVALVQLLEYRPDRPSQSPAFGDDADFDEEFDDDGVFDGDGAFDGESGWDDAGSEDGSFLSAVGRELFAGLATYPGPADLAKLTGELDLSFHDLIDLAGIEYCRGLTGLNLAGNQIDNVHPLKDLVKLEFLDLAENDLEDADWLVGLVNLQELDLSANEIDDVAFLDRLPRLRTVDLTGNPVRNKAVLARLEARGVMVVL